MHTLELYTHSDVDLPLSVVTVATASEEEARFGHAYIRVSEHMDLFNIENGTNPRALNSDSKKVKAIRQTLEEECGFAIYNGGVCIVIDDNSLIMTRRHARFLSLVRRMALVTTMDNIPSRAFDKERPKLKISKFLFSL